ncbi:MAG: hypothetical protein V7L29_15940 [Nostoc sp.]|uniref:hypothetical protein n=1 Tax=Nostoc sp. TaxID=1180 RepID=UPI002FF6B0E2
MPTAGYAKGLALSEPNSVFWSCHAVHKCEQRVADKPKGREQRLTPLATTLRTPLRVRQSPTALDSPQRSGSPSPIRERLTPAVGCPKGL